jgi:pimeloyl-ACP methyl ester carboxylesterase
MVRRYRHDIAEAGARLRAVDRRVIDSPYGPMEYAERGAGRPLLVSHGIFHGCDGGLLSVRDLLDDRRVIAPSRFGYLGSALPASATAADQADAFVALLDRLQLESVDVIAISAGTSAGAQLALRHPDRVDHLIFSSGNFPSSTTADAPPAWAKAFYSDPMMWTLKTLARPAFRRLMGIPGGFPRTTDDARVIEEMLNSIFPVAPRRDGAVFDAYVSNPEVSGYPWESLRVPTLILHTQDDPLTPYASAAAAAKRIPHATLVTLESGGHLQLGQAERSRAEVKAFLAGQSQSTMDEPATRS